MVGQATDTRSQDTNDKLAWARLIKGFEKLVELRKAEEAQARRKARGPASFGNQSRTYRLGVDAPGVTDHRTGVHVTYVRQVLDGDIDPFLRGA